MLAAIAILVACQTAAPAAPAAPSAPAAPHAAAPAPLPTEPGFVRLFDGTTLAGWTGDTKGYGVEDGAITCLKDGTNLYTDREFSNFVLRLRFRLSPGANNGIGVRAPLEGDAAYAGMEIQVLDDGHEKYKGWLKDWQRHGSVYGVVASKGGSTALKPCGEWNDEEIVVDGRRVKVTLNGTVILDADLDQATKDGTLSGKPHSGLSRTTGHIGFLGHGDRVWYRDIRISELPAKTENKNVP
jgi:hypothetical protein